MILREVSPIAAIFQATLCGSACITTNTRSAGQCNSFLFIEQDKECKLGKAALYERDFKEQGGMEVFVKLNLDGSLPIASDGWFSSWASWQDCSKTCAGGRRKRSKAYTPPVNGGQEVLSSGGSSLEIEGCNTQICPIDGNWQEWSSWCCSTCCGAGGVGSRSRSCDPPRYGGKDCEGADEETGQACNEEKTCSSGALNSAVIQGNELDDVDVDGTSLKGYSHTLSSCAQVFVGPRNTWCTIYGCAPLSLAE